jgi:hypothetical protein
MPVGNLGLDEATSKAIHNLDKQVHHPLKYEREIPII